jgi:hypothetical protein
MWLLERLVAIAGNSIMYSNPPTVECKLLGIAATRNVW